jgi:hypothetical protein
MAHGEGGTWIYALVVIELTSKIHVSDSQILIP